MISIMADVIAWVKTNGPISAIIGTGSPVDFWRIYNNVLPQNPVYPCLVVTRISDIALADSHDEHTSGPRQARVQFDAYALTVAEVEDLMETLFTELAGEQGAFGSQTYVGVFDAGQNPDMDFQEAKSLRNVKGRSRDFLIIY